MQPSFQLSVLSFEGLKVGNNLKLSVGDTLKCFLKTLEKWAESAKPQQKAVSFTL